MPELILIEKDNLSILCPGLGLITLLEAKHFRNKSEVHGLL